MGQSQVKNNPEEEDQSIPILLSDIEEDNKEMDINQLAYFGLIEDIKIKLEQDDFTTESLVRKLDNLKMTPVHNAALGGGQHKQEIVSMLLKHDLDDIRSARLDPLVNIKDIKGKTPTHYAAASQNPELVSILLKKFHADPNIIDEEGLTPLLICCRQAYSKPAITCVEVLLQSPILNRDAGQQMFNRTPIHLAAEAMGDEMLRFLLDKGFAHFSLDSRGMSPLHLAVNSGDSTEAVSITKQLLNLSTREQVNCKSGDGQTALHLASFKCHCSLVKVLLDDPNVDIWEQDNLGRTALHWAVEAWFRPRSLPAVKLLCESKHVSDWRSKARFLYGDNTDIKTETAMDIALKHKSIRIAEYLITAHPSPEVWLNDSMIQKIYHSLPESMIPLLNKIGITYNPAKFHERNESVDVQFGPLTGYQDPVESEPKPESKYLNNILQAPKEIRQTILLHPLVQLFIESKWRKIRFLTWMEIAFQFVWLLLYTMFIMEVYVPNCPNTEKPVSEDDHNTHPTDPPEKIKHLKFLLSLGFYSKEDSTLADCTFDVQAAVLMAIFLYSMNVVIIIKEFFQMMHNTKYFKDFTNYAQWLLLVVFVLNSVPAFTGGVTANWQVYTAALGIFMAWVLNLREIGKLPKCGIYAAILKRIAWHCLLMLVFFFSLLVAFGLSLRLLLPGKGQYTYLIFAIVKVVVLMTGELDFDESFYKDDGPHLDPNFIFAQFVFLLLVFITTIVLLNLLTGLAVNDVQSLIEEAEVNRLSNELEQIYLLESLILLIRTKIGLERCTDLFHRSNVTSVVCPDYVYFTSKISGIETRSFGPDLRKRIKDVMVPVEEGS